MEDNCQMKCVTWYKQIDTNLKSISDYWKCIRQGCVFIKLSNESIPDEKITKVNDTNLIQHKPVKTILK